jgi:regulator of PEP synthase PpsR (kinase-PPPase family)
VDPQEEYAVKPDQTVSEMVEEVFSRQAWRLVNRSGMSFEEATAAIAATEAGLLLQALREG